MNKGLPLLIASSLTISGCASIPQSSEGVSALKLNPSNQLPKQAEWVLSGLIPKTLVNLDKPQLINVCRSYKGNTQSQPIKVTLKLDGKDARTPWGEKLYLGGIQSCTLVKAKSIEVLYTGNPTKPGETPPIIRGTYEFMTDSSDQPWMVKKDAQFGITGATDSNSAIYSGYLLNGMQNKKNPVRARICSRGSVGTVASSQKLTIEANRTGDPIDSIKLYGGMNDCVDLSAGDIKATLSTNLNNGNSCTSCAVSVDYYIQLPE